MKKIGLSFFCLILLSLSVLFLPRGDKHYDLTLCCITRDEAEFLPEWIEFHLKQGVQHFYIYDNLNKTDLHHALRKYVKKGLVDIASWPYEHHDDLSWVKIQFAAYEDYVKHHKNHVEWCAFIDTDEFLFCPDGTNLRKFLRRYKDYQEVLVSWILYGTSGVKKAPDGKLIQSLLYRSPDNYYLRTKPIVKLRYVKEISHPHYIHVRNPSKAVDENYNIVRPEDEGFCPKIQSVNQIRINHYAFRDVKFFEEVKIPRYLKRGDTLESVLNLESQTNAVYDDCILKCIR